jgi:hypothetical protein
MSIPHPNPKSNDIAQKKEKRKKAQIALTFCRKKAMI